jgi:hypothetical protein
MNAATLLTPTNVLLGLLVGGAILMLLFPNLFRKVQAEQIRAKNPDDLYYEANKQLLEEVERDSYKLERSIKAKALTRQRMRHHLEAADLIEQEFAASLAPPAHAAPPSPTPAAPPAPAGSSAAP